ncbi:GDSL-like Lipase/Acylhydrolase family protein [Synechococcus sp. MIT S9220]|uniref:SGNH/GDSL hydrolase family protein n=1 Tax=unclassified Synechococcus TaxID=2626047 RepID=UPI00164A9C24|nr:SGNH/GDSL hydrolase family protein [Synechococcus sp. MIT S9220]NOL48049.1 hypothetical protein [Synechococcus sp. MIT S9220]QNJ21513.1 GDSL-like Lipase/Acylhydrolase family protein [Synechococcus sp. MIT S9220]
MRSSRVFFNICLFIGAVLASFALVEVGLRILGIHYPAFYIVDSKRGYGLRPNARGLYSREGQALVEINEAGFRGSLPSSELSDSVYRIAVLGDSFTEGLQVDEDETWIKVLEKQLNMFSSCSILNYRNAEVLNFGVGGYGTGQSLLTWRYQASKFRPDLVILAVYPGNDFSDNEPNSRDDRPTFRISSQGLLEQDDSFKLSKGYLFRTSIVGRVLDQFVNHSRFLQLLNESKNRVAAFRRSPNSSQSDSLSVAPSPPPNASPNAWILTEALIMQLNRDVQASGARLLVVSTSSPDQVWPIASQRSSDPFLQERRLADFLASENIPYLSLGPLLQHEVDQAPGRLFLHGFHETSLGLGHWNSSGHNAAARIISPWLCQQ